MNQSSSLNQNTSPEASTSALTNVKVMLKRFPHVRTALRLLLESENPLMLSSVGGKCSPHQSRQNHACLRQLENDGIVTISNGSREENSLAPSLPLIAIVQEMQHVVRQAIEDIKVVDNGDDRPMKKKKKNNK